MTTEIAVANRGGIALAADSAVTITIANGQKVYNTVNKLFTLSKHRPVGIMVYGSAEIMQIPWEIVIKKFRAELGEEAYNTLDEYAKAFLNWLDNDNALFGDEIQQMFVSFVAELVFREVLEQIDNEVKSAYNAGTTLTEAEVKNICAGAIDELKGKLETQPLGLEHLPEDFASTLASLYDAEIQEAATRVFQDLPLDEDQRTALLESVADILASQRFHPNMQSGIVIAGYGEADIFPSIRAYHIDGVVGNRLRYKPDPGQSNDIGFKNNATISTFAQTNESMGFIKGISPAYEELVNGFLERLVAGYPEKLLGFVESAAEEALTEDVRQEILDRCQKAGQTLLAKCHEEMAQYQQEAYIRPVLNILAVLPKDELAVMAESLVHLTSIKRRFSLEVETVGGPVDVAVISKGDGFVWIKRKHYFDARLNPQFMETYFKQ